MPDAMDPNTFHNFLDFNMRNNWIGLQAQLRFLLFSLHWSAKSQQGCNSTSSCFSTLAIVELKMNSIKQEQNSPVTTSDGPYLRRFRPVWCQYLWFLYLCDKTASAFDSLWRCKAFKLNRALVNHGKKLKTNILGHYTFVLGIRNDHYTWLQNFSGIFTKTRVGF